MFENDTEDAQIKIIDWGLSATFEKDTSRLSSLKGTPQFIAPEVFKGEYDSKCDIWSIGVITYVILVWKYPYKGTNVKDYFESLGHDEINYDVSALKNVSKDCLNFMKSCLEKDPKKRLTIKECHDHPFFDQVKQKMRTINLDENVLMNLKRYNPPQTKIHNFMEKNFINLLYDENEIQYLRNQFQYIDVGGEGFITLQELKEAYLKAGMSLSDDELQQIMSNADKRKNKMTDYSEFIIAGTCKTKVFEKKNLLKIFNYFDEDNSNVIDVNNLKSYIIRTQQKENILSDEEFSNLIKEIVKSENQNYITMDDFLSYFEYKEENK